MARIESVEQQPMRGLDEARRASRKRGLPPVDEWDPAFSGDLDITIARDGTWFYLGSEIKRQRLVRLFASILRRDDDGRYYLVTPVEKVGITVEDAPFLAVSMDVEGNGPSQQVTFHTNVGDEARAGHEHPLRFARDAADGLKPYVHVRGRLEALISRALVYDLVEIADERVMDGEECIGIWSGGAFFPIGSADDITKQ